MASRLSAIPILLAMGLASPAYGQVTAPCGPEEGIYEYFLQTFGESPVSEDEALDGQAVVVRLENPQTGTYSVLVILKGKRACLVDAGQEGRS